jgi:hypothetical protein
VTAPEDPADAAVIIREGAVGEGEVGFFEIPMALHEEQERLVVGGLAPDEHRLGSRTDLAPDLAPHVAR